MQIWQRVRNSKIWRLRTAIILSFLWFVYWGLKDGLITLSLPIGFFALFFIISHIISKEIFKYYNWDIGQRLNDAWQEANLPRAILAAAMLLARVVIYALIALSLTFLASFLLRGTAFGSPPPSLVQVLKEEQTRIWPESDIYILMGQITQESSWREYAKRVEPSGVISYGLFQVTDRTYNELRAKHPTLLDGEPVKMLKARYSIRAGILYDLQMWKVTMCKETEDMHYYYMLRAYNGGLGLLNKEIRQAGTCNPRIVAQFCKRKEPFCKINVSYPLKIFKYAEGYRNARI